MKSNITIVTSFITITCLVIFSISCDSESGNITETTEKRITEERIDASNDGAIDYTIKYRYHNSGQLAEKRYEGNYLSTEPDYRYFYYNSDGFLEEEILEDDNGNELFHSYYVYDDSCIANKVNSNTDHTHGSYTEYIYCDEEGNKIRSQYDYDQDDLIDSIEGYEIDDFGNTTAKRRYNPDGIEDNSFLRLFENEYDNNGNLTSNTGYYNDTIFYVSTFAYDDENLMTSWTLNRYSEGEYDSSSIVYYFYD